MRYDFLNVCNDVTKTATKISQSDYLSNGLYPIYDQGKNIIAGYYNNANGIANEYPYIVFGDHTRVIKYVDTPCFIGADGVKLIKVTNSNFLAKYVYYSMIANPVDSQGYSRHYKFLKETTIEYVDKDTQLKIIDELNMINYALRNKINKLTLLDKLIKSRFIELFGDSNLNNKHWMTGRINDIGKCVAGATPSTIVKEYWENGTIPWMSSGEVNKGRIFETDTKITELGYNNASTKLVPPKTVVLAMAGQGKTRGTAAMTEIELCTNQSICSIVNNEKVNPEYLLYFLKMQYDELRSSSNGAEGRGGLNLKIIGNYPIMIPPINLQNEFADFVQLIDKSKFVDYSRYFL